MNQNAGSGTTIVAIVSQGSDTSSASELLFGITAMMIATNQMIPTATVSMTKAPARRTKDAGSWSNSRAISKNRMSGQRRRYRPAPGQVEPRARGSNRKALRDGSVAQAPIGGHKRDLALCITPKFRRGREVDGVETSDCMSIAQVPRRTREFVGDFHHENRFPSSFELSARGAKDQIIYPCISPRPRERNPGFCVGNPAADQSLRLLHGLTHFR